MSKSYYDQRKFEREFNYGAAAPQDGKGLTVKGFANPEEFVFNDFAGLPVLEKDSYMEGIGELQKQCNHLKIKKVIISKSMQFYLCEHCKADLGDAK